MKKIILLATIVLFSATLSGCFRHTIDVGDGAADGAVVYDRWHPHFLGGLIGNRPVSVKEVCPAGNATIWERTTFGNALLSGVTLGIFTPTSVTISCDNTKALPKL